MTDLNVILETILLLASPFIPVAIGVMLRRKFPGGEAMTGAQKAGRWAGNILLWGGILGILFMVIVLLNFKGKI
jgi:hypothetical protein